MLSAGEGLITSYLDAALAQRSPLNKVGAYQPNLEL